MTEAFRISVDAGVPGAPGVPGVPGAGDTDHLLNLLQRQLHLYERLDQMSREQSALIEAGSTQQLLELLSKRNRLVQEQTKVGAELEPFRQHWGEVLAAVDGTDRRWIEKTVGESERILARIIEQDNRDRQALERAKQSTSGELGKVVHTGSAVRAYTSAAGQMTNRYTNRQG